MCKQPLDHMSRYQLEGKITHYQGLYTLPLLQAVHQVVLFMDEEKQALFKAAPLINFFIFNIPNFMSSTVHKVRPNTSELSYKWSCERKNMIY